MRGGWYLALALGLMTTAGSCNRPSSGPGPATLPVCSGPSCNPPVRVFASVSRSLGVSDPRATEACMRIDGHHEISRVCANSGAQGLATLRVEVDPSVGCVKVTEAGGAHLAFLAAGDSPTRDWVQLQPTSRSASFGIERGALRIEAAEAGNAFSLATGRLQLEAFTKPCWQVCANQHGKFSVEFGGQPPRAYAGDEDPCLVLSQHAVGAPAPDAGSADVTTGGAGGAAAAGAAGSAAGATAVAGGAAGVAGKSG